MASKPLPKLPSSERCHEVPIMRQFPHLKEIKQASSREYTIKSNPFKHKLPAPKTLRPYIDHTTGKFDTWPAHASKPTQCHNEKEDKRLCATPKAEFLLQLEQWLEIELKCIATKGLKQQVEDRLQAYRQVFTCIIENFKTYQPLLASIKNEYESVLDAFRGDISDLEPLRSLVTTVADECDQKMLALKQDERGTIAALEAKHCQLQDIIKEMGEEKDSLNAQIKKLQQELADEYHRYRHESDARKLLIQDLNEIRAHQEQAKRMAGETEHEEEKSEDAVLLRVALRKAREDLQLKTEQLAQMTADYGDVVPRREFEMVDTEFKAYKEEYDTLTADNERLLKENRTLLELHSRAEEQRNEYREECELMRRCATPRPDWVKCGAYIEGGPERWDELTARQSSDYNVDLLLCEMTGQDIAVIQAGRGNQVEHFEGLGYGEDVPVYLHAEGQIVNKRLSKRDTSKLITDIWQAKQDYANEGDKEMGLDEFFSFYLENNYQGDEAKAEVAYNLHDACTRYSYDEYIATFANVLRNELDESVYWEQQNQITSIRKTITTAIGNGGNSDEITIVKFRKVLDEMFALKTGESIDALMQAAEMDLGGFGAETNLDDLFAENAQGPLSNFVAKIMEQNRKEKEEYLAELEESLRDKSEATVRDVKTAFMAIDSGLTQDTCNEYMVKGLHVTIEKLMDVAIVDKSALFRNLRSANVNRKGPKLKQ